MNNSFDINYKLSKIVEVNIPFNASLFSTEELKVIEKLVDASKLIDKLYLSQIYKKNDEIIKKLSSENQSLLKYFMWNMGPWDRLNDDAPFAVDFKRPLGVEFYPKDISKKEFLDRINNSKDKDAFTSFYTVIKRRNNELIAVPYSAEYAEILEPLSAIIEDAAQITTNQSLKKFLHERAKAFLSNDYFNSEILYIDLDSKIEATIGPYEVYDDMLFGYKASFESFIHIKNHDESKKLELYSKYLSEIDNILPVDKKYVFTKKSQESHTLVTDLIYSGGGANGGYRAQAYNLPNDDKVREIKGSKKVLIKNIMSEKFTTLVLPMVDRLILESQKKYINFDAHFKFVLFHELSHGLGPAFIIKNGIKSPISDGMMEYSSGIEEAKADICGIYIAEYLISKKVIQNDIDEIYATYLINIFRAIRFGISEAHGMAMMMEYNYLKLKGGIKFENNKFCFNSDCMRKGITSLLEEFLNIQASGSYDLAKEFVKKYNYIPTEIKDSIEGLKEFPIDISLVFQYDKKSEFI